MLIIGSEAARHHGFSIDRKRLDRDVIGTLDQFRRWTRMVRHKIESCTPLDATHWVVVHNSGGRTIFEWEIAQPGTVGYELLRRHGHEVDGIWDDPEHATPAELLMLKLSHRYKKNSPHFLKTMRDIQMFRAAGVTLDEELTRLLKQREAETYTYRHPSLTRKKEEFFGGDGVEYVYDHDSIHEVLTVLDRPAYTYFKADQAEVFCDRAKFDAAPRVIQLLSVLEEAQVLAIERSQVPHAGKVTPRRSFEIALMKVCTSITSGWWREFAWGNYDAVLAMHDDGYVERFWRAEREGRVRPYKAVNMLKEAA